MKIKPSLSFWQIWNMCFGFLGIQFGFALQNANVSRIFQTLGADIEVIPLLWIAAPLTGLLVQPIVGYYSDRTWSGLGRRRPYFLFGAIVATIALAFMPNSPQLWIAAGMLWIMDASINVSMEPFRALVADQLPPRQRPTGYAMQSFFIGVGAVVASLLPWLLAQWDVSNVAPPGMVPDTVKFAFYAGAAVLLLAVLWTVLTTREYPPDELTGFNDARQTRSSPLDAARTRRSGLFWLLAGVIGLIAIRFYGLDQQLYILAAGLTVYGAALLILSRGRGDNMFSSIMSDLYSMPDAMRRLAVVQFFSWFALFAMWIYTTAAVTSVHFGSSDTSTAAYNEGANWVGVLFAAYNGFAALAAIVIPWMSRRLGLRVSHLINVWLGAAGLLSFLFIRDPDWLLLAMVGVGFAWASILSVPYALLADNLPTRKMGVYMGIFNFFIVIPQLLAAALLGFLLKTFFNSEPIYALVIGAVSLFIAGFSVFRVAEPQTSVATAGAQSK
ncbi:MAG: MFS transporter [Wenzhouxiangellaceae bacterium]